MQKNVAGQVWYIKAWDETDNTVKTGDAANITANLRLDGGAANAIDDVNPTELEGGYYFFDITQAESNADYILICPSSSTLNIQVEGCPKFFTTTPDMVALASNIETLVTRIPAEVAQKTHLVNGTGDITPPTNKGIWDSFGDGTKAISGLHDFDPANDDVAKVTVLDGHTAQTGDSFARIGAPVAASISADIAVVDGNVDGIVTEITRPTGAVVADAANAAGGFVTDLSETANDYWAGGPWVKFITGNLTNQVKKVASYNGTTKFLTFTSVYTETPAAGDDFEFILE